MGARAESLSPPARRHGDSYDSRPGGHVDGEVLGAWCDGRDSSRGGLRRRRVPPLRVLDAL
jgi:hypothetical protein